MSKAQALSVCKVLEMVQQCLHSLGKPHLFQAPCILFLQELLSCQKDFTRYVCTQSGTAISLFIYLLYVVMKDEFSSNTGVTI